MSRSCRFFVPPQRRMTTRSPSLPSTRDTQVRNRCGTRIHQYTSPDAFYVREVSQLQPAQRRCHFRRCRGIEALKPGRKRTRSCSVKVLENRQPYNGNISVTIVKGDGLRVSRVGHCFDAHVVRADRRRQLNEIAVSDRATLARLTQFTADAALALRKPLNRKRDGRRAAEVGGVCDNLCLATRNSLNLKRRDVRVVEGARLEIESGGSHQFTPKRINALSINHFRNNGVHCGVPVNHGV